MSIRRLLLLLLALAPALAHAQTPPPAGNIDDRVRQQIPTLTDRERDEAMITGDTDLVLLRRTRLFTLHGGFEVSPTSNAFLSPGGSDGDILVQASAGLRIGTRIAGKVDLFADAGVVTVRYFDNKSLGYNALTGAVGVAARLKPFDVTLSYQPSIVYDRKFDNKQITQHRLRADIAAPIAWKGFQIVPSAAVERALSHPSDYKSWAYSAELSVTRALSKKAPVFGFASAGYERREYDSYFFDFLGVNRNDDLLRATVGVVWRPRPWADVRASYTFTRNWSTSDVNGYKVHSGQIGVSAAIRF